MDDLLKEAIADAKAVRETALANAKMALEEAFTPKLKSMLAQKIQQEIEDEDEVADEVADAEEIEDEEEGYANSEEGEEDKEEMSHEVEDKDEEEKVDENDVSSEIGKSDNKVNPKANDSTETGAQGPEGEGKDEPAGNELDDHEVVKEEEDKEEEMDEDIDLEEVLKALSEEEDEEEKVDEIEKLQAEIKEHRDVVTYLREKLNEVNLLNAKLLFSNKLFRAFGLSNEQKLKVVETFDRTTNLREIKLVYSTLAESFKGGSVKPVNESKGSSSKPVASTKPQNEEVISEGAELKNRFKKLANIL